ncbi:MAG: 2-hydroxychromene-2-carboxylate isomerase [Sneathiella sp.]
MPKVDFHMDFASPNSYLCHKLIPGIEERTGAKFEYFPVLLGGLFKLTNNQAPFVTYANVKNKPEYLKLEMQRFIRDHDLNNFRMNQYFPINTVQVMRGAIVAEMDKFLPEYVDSIMNAMWEKNLNVADPEVLANALAADGLDAAHIMARIQEQDVKDQLIANTEKSASMGVFGCPSFFVGDELFFGKENMRTVEDEINRQK